jgi:hypothetical protein
MNLLENCSTKNFYPWLHYIINNYFDEDTLKNLIKEIDNLPFKKAKDDFRDEFNLDYDIKNPIFSSILDNFLQKENIDYLSSIDNRIKNINKLLRVSIWKDYKNFRLPIHTDSHFKLFTMQIYLPRNNEFGYGTSIYDQEGKFIKTTNYNLNDGYFFFPNINNVKTNHSFVEDIKSERCSIVFNIIDKEKYLKRNSITITEKLSKAKKVINFIEF